MIYLILVNFLVSLIVLELERYYNPTGLIGGAINRCNILERFIFYGMPIVSEVYIILLAIEKYKPEWLVTIDWSKVEKSAVY